MNLLDLAKDVLTALWPSSNPAHDMRWRISIALATMSLIGAVGLIIALATGMIGFLYPGVASIGDLSKEDTKVGVGVTSLLATLHSLQRGQLDAKLRDLDHTLIGDRVAFCQAAHDNNTSAKGFADQRFRQDFDTYTALSGGVAWRIPDCSELL